MVLMEAPTANEDILKRLARTGAPAWASTALIPTVRSRVLLPDMLEPLTTSTCGPEQKDTSLRTTSS